MTRVPTALLLVSVALATASCGSDSSGGDAGATSRPRGASFTDEQLACLKKQGVARRGPAGDVAGAVMGSRPKVVTASLRRLRTGGPRRPATANLATGSASSSRNGSRR